MKRADASIITRGYENWKDAIGEKSGFCQHEASGCHKAAVEAVVTISATTKDVEMQACKEKGRKS